MNGLLKTALFDINVIKARQLENGPRVETEDIEIGLFYHVSVEINGIRIQTRLFCQEFSDGLEPDWS